jgi:hypothetical protein
MNVTRSPRILPACLLLLVCAVQLIADDASVTRDEIDRDFVAQLKSLTEMADQQKWDDYADLSRHWYVSRDPYHQVIYLGNTPGDSELPKSGADPKLRSEWWGKFVEARRQHASGLWKIAEHSADAGDYDLAYRTLFEILRDDPEHPAAQRIVGNEAAQRLVPIRARAGRTRHNQYGWNAGQYWVTDSEHFRITTSAGEAEGEQLAIRLENLFAAWRQLFLRYWASEAVLERCWKTQRSLPTSSRKHQVVLFATRDEYVAYLRRYEPQIEKSLGVYRDAQRAAFFYLSDDTELQSTWLHEATHQLFHEEANVRRDVGMESHFWMVEAVALYMESLDFMSQGVATDSRDADYCIVGGCEADRLQYARYRRLMENFYVPLEQLSSLGRVELQQHPELRRLYSQSAGLAHFLMDGDQGRYRRAAVEYVSDIYGGRVQSSKAPTWQERTGLTQAELDERYGEFLTVTDEALMSIRNAPQIRNLSLGRTQVTDRGLQALADCRQLEWLDLSFCHISDAGFAVIADVSKLRQLSLEGTKITDTSLRRLQVCTELEELDLSGTAITDEGLRSIAELRSLRALWLTGTSVGNEGLQQLVQLKNLETLEIQGTQVTPAGFDSLKSAWPRLGSP